MIRILLVEDNAIVRKVVKVNLKSSFQALITIAESGNEAIKILQGGETFELIISDYCMNDGNGLDLLNFIYSKNIVVPFTFFTSLNNPLLPNTDNHFLGVINKDNITELNDLVFNIINSKIN